MEALADPQIVDSWVVDDIKSYDETMFIIEELNGVTIPELAQLIIDYLIPSHDRKGAPIKLQVLSFVNWRLVSWRSGVVLTTPNIILHFVDNGMIIKLWSSPYKYSGVVVSLELLAVSDGNEVSFIDSKGVTVYRQDVKHERLLLGPTTIDVHGVNTVTFTAKSYDDDLSTHFKFTYTVDGWLVDVITTFIHPDEWEFSVSGLSALDSFGERWIKFKTSDGKLTTYRTNLGWLDMCTPHEDVHDYSVLYEDGKINMGYMELHHMETSPDGTYKFKQLPGGVERGERPWLYISKEVKSFDVKFTDDGKPRYLLRTDESGSVKLYDLGQYQESVHHEDMARDDYVIIVAGSEVKYAPGPALLNGKLADCKLIIDMKDSNGEPVVMNRLVAHGGIAACFHHDTIYTIQSPDHIGDDNREVTIILTINRIDL